MTLLLHWIAIVIRGDTVMPWERRFCASFIAASRRPSKRGPWRPDSRQLPVMGRIVERFQRDVLGDEDGNVTE